MDVRVRIVEHGKQSSVVEYNGKDYIVNTEDLHNVNTGWTYGWISKNKLVD